jgi:hypothetical protein
LKSSLCLLAQRIVFAVQETHENVPDDNEDISEDVPADDFSDGSDDERTEDQEGYPATDEEEENEYE